MAGLHELGRHRIMYHPGSGAGGGTENAAHGRYHRQLYDIWLHDLPSMTVRQKRKARPRIREFIRYLSATAEVTDGNPQEHRDVSVAMVNKLLPKYLAISSRHLKI